MRCCLPALLCLENSVPGSLGGEVWQLWMVLLNPSVWHKAWVDSHLIHCFKSKNRYERCHICSVRRGASPTSSQVPEVLLHPFLQLFGDLLFLPFSQICHKHSWVEGAVSGVNAQVFNFLFPVVQEAHVGCLWREQPWFNFQLIFSYMESDKIY